MQSIMPAQVVAALMYLGASQAAVLGERLACLQTADGKVLWTKSLAEDFGGIVPPWSYRESPLVDGNLKIFMPDAADALVVALRVTRSSLARAHGER